MGTILKASGLNVDEMRFFDMNRAIAELNQRDGMAQITATTM